MGVGKIESTTQIVKPKPLTKKDSQYIGISIKKKKDRKKDK
jgi:hypothetical protein